jgi:GT2 family glycosyltransferase
LHAQSDRPRVALMILNYNGLRWLKTCLPSATKSTYPNLEIYVVDNGSWDGSCEFVESNYRRVKLARFAENLGFAEAYNRAIAGVEAEYVVLLNNDTEVLDPEWIGALVDRAERDLSVAAVACKLVTMEDHQRLDSVGVMGIKYWRGFVDIGKHELDRGQYDNPPVAPFSASGAAMLIRRSYFERVGGFDTQFYNYAEDADLCWRLRLLGHTIAYDPSAKVAHYFSGTVGEKETGPTKLYFCHRNLLRAIIKNCGASLGWALRNYFLFTSMLVIGYCVLDPRKVVALLRALMWNLFTLTDAYGCRLTIQRTATVNETQILALMYPAFRRFQPEEWQSLRRILDTVFERKRKLQLGHR